ncbi:Insulin-like growth factor binding protein, N-terminal [Pseudocohnilembus persalinus]|uniref:Insulin-like growth factor binding protein, N-terminal n=1 Tax=Pseudocohnilembus persalinus TaxID=266149 RepID=A0A0V0QH76_PSEPJ|nr:Insulin-like growth factor binding protein, N-terminal [Pseudocohnilembus persalinus]|eukprot:KRX01561.1 Insulin-like growth factor binding protein, N-terminal [Pseudocohnilembus persalinus]
MVFQQYIGSLDLNDLTVFVFGQTTNQSNLALEDFQDYFDGQISDIRIYDQRFTARQIKKIYESYISICEFYQCTCDASKNECISCTGDKQLINGKCICPNGFFDDYISTNCVQVSSILDINNSNLLSYFPFGTTKNLKDPTLIALPVTYNTTNRNEEPRSAYKLKGPSVNWGPDAQYVSLPISNKINGLSEFTFSIWTKLDVSATVNQGLIYSLAYSGQENHLIFGFKEFNTNNVAFFHHEAYFHLLELEFEWQQIILSVNNTNYSIYQNGIYIGTYEKDNLILNVDLQGFILGQEQDTVGGSFEKNGCLEGQVSDFKIFSQYFSTYEAQVLYYAEKNNCPFGCEFCDQKTNECLQCKGNRNLIDEKCLCPINTIEDYTSTNCPDLTTTIQDSQISYYPLKNSGQDTMGNHDITNKTDAFLTSVKNRFNEINSAYELQGSPDSYLVIPKETINQKSQVTIDLWATKGVSDSQQRTLISGAKADPPISNDRQDDWFFFGSKSLFYYSNDLTKPEKYKINTQQLPIDLGVDEWHHITLTFNTSLIKFYLDGKLYLQTFISGYSYSLEVNSFIVGQQQDKLGGEFVSAEAWSGKVSDIRIYQKTLTETEVKMLHEYTQKYQFTGYPCSENFCEGCYWGTEICAKCSQGYYLNQYNVCEECDAQCESCDNTSDSCTVCKGDNRSTITPNCDCLDGYYHVPDQENCQQCDVQCFNCENSPDQCTVCQGNNRSMAQPNCDCLDGYYHVTGQQNCEQCDVQCYSCETTPDNCTACKGNNRTTNTPSCECQNGYYHIVGQENCQSCNYQCLTCETSPDNCTSCKGTNRSTSFPQCLCLQGFYDDGTNSNCQDCDRKCLSCENSASNCTACKGLNRLNDFPTCSCEDGYYDNGVDSDCYQCGDLNCKTCQTSNPSYCMQPFDGYYTDNGNVYSCSVGDSIIEIISLKEVNIELQFVGYLSDNTQTQNTFNNKLCQYLFDSNQLQKFGANPTCKYKSTSLTSTISILFNGYTVEYLQFEEIQIKPVIYKQTCSQAYHVSSYSQTFNEIDYSIIPDATVTLSKIKQVSLCQDIKISIINQQNDGFHSLYNITWEIQGANPIPTSAHQNQINSLLSNYDNQTNYYSQTFQLEVLSDKTAMIDLLDQNNPYQIKPNQYNYIYFQIYLLECNQNSEEFQVNYVDLDYFIYQMTDNTYSNIDQTLQNNKVLQENKGQGQFIIEPYMLTAGNSYYIQFSPFLEIQGQNVGLQGELQIDVQILGYLVYIKGGNRMQSYSQATEIFGVYSNQNVDYSQQQDGFQLNWECQNLLTQEQCKNTNGQVVNINQNVDFLSFEPKLFDPYSTLNITFIATINSEVIQDSAIIIFVELDSPTLSVTLPDNIFSTKINMNDDIYVNVQYDNEVNNDGENSVQSQNQVQSSTSGLQYHLILQYNLEKVAIKTYQYNEFSFKIWNLFSDFKDDNYEITAKISFYDPNYIMPSYFTFTINLNEPPKIGQLVITPNTGYSAYTQFQISAVNFGTGLNQRYEFYYYLSQKEYDEEKSLGNQSTNLKRQLIRSYKEDINQISTYLPRQNNNNNSQNLIIMVLVKDQQNGVSNTTQTVQINIKNDLDQQINDISTTMKKAQDEYKVNQNWEAVNTYCILAQEMSSAYSLLSSYNTYKELVQQLYNNLINAQPQFIIKNRKQQIQKSLNLLLDILKKLGNSKVVDINSNLNNLNSDIESQLSLFEQFKSNDQLNKCNSEVDQKIEESKNILGKSIESINNLINIQQVNPDLSSNSQSISLISTVEKIANIYNQISLPNSDPILYKGDQITTSIQKQTYQYFNSFFSNSFISTQQDDKRRNLSQNNQKNNDDLQDDDILDIQYSMYDKNVLMNKDFVYTDQSNPIQYYQINKTNSKNKVNINKNINLQFNNYDIKDNSMCLSTSDKNGNWDPNSCKLVDYNNQAECVCKDLQITTIIDDVEGVFSSALSEIKNTFNSDSLSALAEFEYYKSSLFYILLIIIALNIYVVFIGFKKDKQEAPIMQKINEEQAKIKEQKIKRQKKQKQIQQVANLTNIEKQKQICKKENISQDFENYDQNNEVNSQSKSFLTLKQLENSQNSNQFNNNNNNDKQNNSINNINPTNLNLKEDYQVKISQKQIECTGFNLIQDNRKSKNLYKNKFIMHQIILYINKESSITTSSPQGSDQQILESDNSSKKNPIDFSPLSIQQVDKDIQDNKYQNQIFRDTQYSKSENKNFNKKNIKTAKNKKNLKSKKANLQKFQDNKKDKKPVKKNNRKQFNLQECDFDLISYQDTPFSIFSKINSQRNSKDNLEFNNSLSFLDSYKLEKKNGNNISENQTSDQNEEKNIQIKYDLKEKNDKQQGNQNYQQQQISVNQEKILEQNIKINQEQEQLNVQINDQQCLEKIQEDNDRQFQQEKNTQKQKQNVKDIIEINEKSQSQNKKNDDNQINLTQNNNKLKKISIWNTFLIFHQFFCIYFVYSLKKSRPVRFSIFFLKQYLSLGISSLYKDWTTTQLEAIIFNIFILFITSFPVLLVQIIIVRKQKPLKILGIIIYCIIILLSFWITFVSASSMGLTQSNEWTISYVSAFFFDFSASQSLVSAGKNWALNKYGREHQLISKLLDEEMINYYYFTYG